MWEVVREQRFPLFCCCVRYLLKSFIERIANVSNAFSVSRWKDQPCVVRLRLALAGLAKAGLVPVEDFFVAPRALRASCSTFFYSWSRVCFFLPGLLAPSTTCARAWHLPSLAQSLPPLFSIPCNQRAPCDLFADSTAAWSNTMKKVANLASDCEKPFLNGYVRILYSSQISTNMARERQSRTSTKRINR